MAGLQIGDFRRVFAFLCHYRQTEVKRLVQSHTYVARDAKTSAILKMRLI